MGFFGAAAFGYWWLSSSQWVKEDDSSPSMSTFISTTPLPAGQVEDPWSTWYQYEGYFVIGLKTLTGLMMCVAFVISHDEHSVKEDIYKERAARAQSAEERSALALEAQQEHDQEGGCTHILKCVSGCAHCISTCAQCGLCAWCCIGILMLMGAGVLGKVEAGVNNESKWFLIIMGSS